MMDEQFNKKDSRPPKDILQSLFSGEQFKDEKITGELEKLFNQIHESGGDKIQAESNLSDEQRNLLKNLAREIVKSKSKQNLN